MSKQTARLIPAVLHPGGLGFSKALSHPQAIGFALLGYTLWVLSDASLKLVGASTLPSYEVTGTLGLSIALLLLVYAFSLGNPGILWPKSPAKLVLRALLDVANGFGVVIAVRHMPLALFYICIFCSPMVSTLLAALLLGEALHAKRLLALLGGFAGIVISVGPFHLSQAAERSGYLACFVCVLSFSANVVWLRRMTQSETRESLIFFSGAVFAAVGLLATLSRPVHIPLHLAVVIAVAGILNVLGSFCLFRALRWAPAASVAPCHYSQLLTGALIGFLLWHERLSASVLAGAALIVAAGIYNVVQSRKDEPKLRDVEAF